MSVRHRWPPLLATGLVLIAIAITVLAFKAAATNVSVTVTRDCTHLTWTVTNHWDSHVDGIFATTYDYQVAFHLDPGQSTGGSADMSGHPGPITFMASGTFTNGATPIFTYSPASRVVTAPSGCVTTTTTTPPLTALPPVPTPSTSPTTAPGGSSTPAPSPPASVTVPQTGPPDTSSMPTSSSVPGGSGHHSTTTAHQLPVTGMGENVLVVLIVAGSALIVTGSVVLMARSRGCD